MPLVFQGKTLALYRMERRAHSEDDAVCGESTRIREEEAADDEPLLPRPLIVPSRHGLGKHIAQASPVSEAPGRLSLARVIP